MSKNESSNIIVTCPCCDAILTIDPTLPAVLDHKLPARPQVVTQMKDVGKHLQQEASRRDEKYQADQGYRSGLGDCSLHPVLS